MRKKSFKVNGIIFLILFFIGGCASSDPGGFFEESTEEGVAAEEVVVPPADDAEEDTGIVHHAPSNDEIVLHFPSRGFDISVCADGIDELCSEEYEKYLNAPSIDKGLMAQRYIFCRKKWADKQREFFEENPGVGHPCSVIVKELCAPLWPSCKNAQDPYDKKEACAKYTYCESFWTSKLSSE